MTQQVPPEDATPNQDIPTAKLAYMPGPPGIPPPLPGGNYPPLPPARKPFPLGLIIAIVACAVVIPVIGIGLLVPSFSNVHRQADRIKCRSNLKQIGLMALAYANNETRNGGAFPRTCFDDIASMSTIFAGNGGYRTNASFPDPAHAMDPGSSTSVGPNNVTASFYVIMKSADMSPDVYLCPSTQNQRPFGPGSTVGVQDCSNWPDTLNNLSYSYNCPFPNRAAIQAGWRWNNALGPDDPMGADKNPGIGNPMSNGDSGGTDVTAVKYSDRRAAIARGNSNNHNNEGQNVLYCDGHVDWWISPFAGAMRPNYFYRDNIYTCNHAGGSSPASGPTGNGSGDDLTSRSGPGDPQDAYLLPTCSKSGF